MVHSKAFDGLKGNFPIGFLIWDLSKKGKETVFKLPALDKKVNPCGNKTFAIEDKKSLLNVWIKRPKANPETEIIPLNNALNVYPNKPRVAKWSDGAIAYLSCTSNDTQHLKYVFLLSSAYGHGDGFYVNADNLADAAVLFAVRRLIAPTWLNDRDQFLQPSKKLPESFYTDCLLYMLFSGSNLTAGTAKDALEWNGRKWQLTNHFIPYDEAQVGFNGRFQSHFMSDYLHGKKLSKEAQAVYDKGLKLWQAFYRADIERKIRDEYLLDKSGAGWYQIRNALKKATPQTDFAPFETAYAALAAKLEPLVYEYGFLKE